MLPGDHLPVDERDEQSNPTKGSYTHTHTHTAALSTGFQLQPVKLLLIIDKISLRNLFARKVLHES